MKISMNLNDPVVSRFGIGRKTYRWRDGSKPTAEDRERMKTILDSKRAPGVGSGDNKSSDRQPPLILDTILTTQDGRQIAAKKVRTMKEAATGARRLADALGTGTSIFDGKTGRETRVPTKRNLS